MNGELAQLVALVAHTRAALSGTSFSLDLASSTFKFLATLAFDSERSGGSVATTPREWFEYLERSHCQSALLVIGPHAGGRHWGAVTGYDQTQGLWLADWSVGDQKAADRKIWHVCYGEIDAKPTAVGDSIVEASTRLGQVLRLAVQFAGDADLEGWRGCFQSAEEKLTSESPMLEYQTDMLPPTGYSVEARALLSSCQQAWVFGGVGSWNDLGFAGELQQRYDALTPMLYDAVVKGIAAAVNHGLRERDR